MSFGNWVSNDMTTMRDRSSRKKPRVESQLAAYARLLHELDELEKSVANAKSRCAAQHPSGICEAVSRTVMKTARSVT